MRQIITVSGSFLSCWIELVGNVRYAGRQAGRQASRTSQVAGVLGVQK